MSDDEYGYDFGGTVTTFTYDLSGRLLSTEGPTAPRPSWEHDESGRVFRVNGPDGKVVEFHDRALRFLVVAPDPQTGVLSPVLSRGEPKVIYLCREAGQ